MVDTPASAPMGFRGFRRAAVLFWRALTLRCPHCGARGILASWFKLAPTCPRCHLQSERGESDYFLGGMMFNIVLAEAALVVLIIITLAVTWPRVPWSLLQFGAPAAMVVAPVVFYPFSRLIWLAFDLMLRPVVPNDLSPPPSTR